MILIVIAALCLISVPLTGGRLGRLSELRLRGVWIAPLALALQVLIVTVAPSGYPRLHIAVHIATYVMIGVFLAANRRVPGGGSRGFPSGGRAPPTRTDPVALVGVALVG